MRIFRQLSIATLLLLASVAAYANHYQDLYVIPVAGHTPGQNGTNWMSDLAIHNFQSTPLSVQIVVIEAGSNVDNVSPLTTAATSSTGGAVTVPAGGSILLKDVLSGHRGMTNITGALLVGSDRPFTLTSRAYSMSPAGDTVGQTVPGVGNFLDNTLTQIDLATAVAYVPGLIQNAEFRTNLGFVAANASGGGSSMNIEVRIKGANGETLGTQNFGVPSGAVMQSLFSARDLAAGNFDIGAAEFRITSGTGSVVPYASIIDNRTADAVFVTGMFPQNTPATATAFDKAAPSLFRSILDRVSVRAIE